MSEEYRCPVCGAGLTMFGGSYDGKAEQIWFCKECDKIGNGWLWAESRLTLAAATRAREIAEATEPLRGLLASTLDAADRAMHGKPLPSEEWYAVRDAARAEAALDHIGDVNEMVGGDDA